MKGLLRSGQTCLEQKQFRSWYACIDVVEYIADRIVVMNAGRVEEAGATADVLARPRSAYTRSLLAAVPRIAQVSVA